MHVTDADRLTLQRIADALERLAPPPARAPDLTASAAFVFEPPAGLRSIEQVAAVDYALLQGIERVADTLLANTRRFAHGLPANNALLWGARGMGKSSLVKAVHARIVVEDNPALKLIEIHREDIDRLPHLLALLRDRPEPCLLLCDDLSFDVGETSYKSLKTVLDGGIEGRPANVLFYATSNRRHLMPRDMIENERRTAIHGGESVEEKVSLSDRFGLWLGFHACDQATYLAMIDGYIAHYRLDIDADAWRPQAIEWAATRGARSGRVAFQFVQDLAGRLGVPLKA
ncbi:MAG: ATP-binding protein [Geminicoccaceae bacterium]